MKKTVKELSKRAAAEADKIVKMSVYDRLALLRVARAAKALKDIYELPWQTDRDIWTREERAIFEALEEVEHLLG